MEEKTNHITINLHHALWFMFACGIVSVLAVALAWHIATVKPRMSLAEMLGCLPGTEPALQMKKIGERKEHLVARCMPAHPEQ